jgi:hypothetical protein
MKDVDPMLTHPGGIGHGAFGLAGPPAAPHGVISAPR